MEEDLESEKYINVTTGDVIGVILPTTNPIPVIGSSSFSNFLMRSSHILEERLPNLSHKTLELLHLQATLGKLFTS